MFDPFWLTYRYSLHIQYITKYLYRYVNGIFLFVLHIGKARLLHFLWEHACLAARSGCLLLALFFSNGVISLNISPGCHLWNLNPHLYVKSVLSGLRVLDTHVNWISGTRRGSPILWVKKAIPYCLCIPMAVSFMIAAMHSVEEVPVHYSYNKYTDLMHKHKYF